MNDYLVRAIDREGCELSLECQSLERALRGFRDYASDRNTKAVQIWRWRMEEHGGPELIASYIAMGLRYAVNDWSCEVPGDWNPFRGRMRRTG